MYNVKRFESGRLIKMGCSVRAGIPTLQEPTSSRRTKSDRDILDAVQDSHLTPPALFNNAVPIADSIHTAAVSTSGGQAWLRRLQRARTVPQLCTPHAHKPKANITIAMGAVQ